MHRRAARDAVPPHRRSRAVRRNQMCWIRRALGRVEFVARTHMAELERRRRRRASAAPSTGSCASSSGGSGCSGSMSSGLGHFGHRRSGVRRRFPAPGTRREPIEDRLAVLDRQHAPHGERCRHRACDRRCRRSAPRCRRRAGNRRAASAPRAPGRPSACAADSAWPSTCPPNTYVVPMSRLWPRNRLSSSRSSCSSSTSSPTTGLDMHSPDSAAGV